MTDPIYLLSAKVLNLVSLIHGFQEKLFLTTDNLRLDLEQLQLDGERMGKTDLVDETIETEQAPHVEVTEMNKKKLTIKISVSSVFCCKITLLGKLYSCKMNDFIPTNHIFLEIYLN